jgi:putative ATP-dependent endonuclease of the OLD family
MRLLDYKLYRLNLDEFATKVNEHFRRNGGQDQILYSMNRNTDGMLTVTTELYQPSGQITRPVERMGKGMRSIYMLSLLETYTEDESRSPSIIMIEDPEIFLHPTLQKTSGDILYRLSKKHQVIFSTHSPNLLPNFNTRQIRQMVLDENGYPEARSKTDISVILDNLGYTANDLMNVNFVFIVEGKQDKSGLPLLLRRFYSEMYDENGRLSRVAIITTNSCTNIKTYANLKYMNQIYIKDQFLMIRDGDGKDPDQLKRQLCRYYEEQGARDADRLPRVTPKNVLILHYYSFENYFLNPEIMYQLGVIPSVEAFYEIFLEKWKELEDYTKFHFSEEEEYMESIHYEGLEAQKRAHAAFIDRLEQVDPDEIDANPQEYLNELLEFLLNWLINHILYTDKKIPDVTK